MTTQPQPDALRQRLLDHAACHESDHWLMGEDEQRQWAADLREAESLIGRLHAECEALRAGAAKAERRAIMFGDCLTRQILAMRAAVVAWQRDGADAGMNWIANTLAGPGHLPTREEIAIGAQALFEKEVAEAEAFRAANPGPSIDAARAAKEQSND